MILADGEAILEALNDLARRAAGRGFNATVAVLGGAAIELHFPGRGATRDIDALLFRDGLDEVIDEIAIERGWHKNWLNDGVRAFVSDHDDPHQWNVLLQHRDVVVRIAPVAVLVAMKLKAARGRRDFSDLDLLLDDLEWSQSEAQDCFDRYFPHDVLSARAQEYLDSRGKNDP